MRFITRLLNTNVVKKELQPYFPYARQPVNLSPPQSECQLSKIKNGLVLCSLENNLPLVNLGVVIKAGSRYESIEDENLGITHMLRISSSLATQNCSQFGLSRNLDHIGASVIVNTSRDHFFYAVQCKRENIDTALKYLSAIVTASAYKHWEVKDNMYKLNFDLQALENDYETRVVEDIHRTVFRNGLNNSLFSPHFMVGKHTCPMLRDYYGKHFTVQKSALIGLGMSHTALANYAYKYFAHYNPGSGELEDIGGSLGAPSRSSPDYQGSSTDTTSALQNRTTTGEKLFYPGEIRYHRDSPLTYALLVTEGASLSNSKDMLSLAVLQHVMGIGPRVKYGSMQLSGRLARHTLNYKLNTILTPFAISCYNANYIDTGLFGVYIVSQPDYMDRLLKCAIDCFRDLGRNGVKADELANAKTRLISSYLMSLEDSMVFLEDVMMQTLMTHQVASRDSILKSIQAINADDVTRVAKRLVAKCGLAVRGNLRNTPYLDELIN